MRDPMLSLCRQIIVEWEESQGRDKTPSKDIDEAGKKILEDSLRSCGIIPDGESIEFLDKILGLLRAESCHEE